MSFNILYVEDLEIDWEPVRRVIEEQKDPWSESLCIERAKNPEEMKQKLGLRFDFVIADVYFRDSGGIEEDRLDDIIGIVGEWSAAEGVRPLPIVAYTGKGNPALKDCLRRKDFLYDIWDKNTAGPEYIAWRLSQVAVAISRARPDALLQRLIREMTPAVSWHENVVDMVRGYNAGWTEYDQIERASTPILGIARSLDVFEQCQRAWESMTGWEFVGRSVSHAMRGHGRHVINVFWLGYFLLNHELLKPVFEKAWKRALGQRKNMAPVSDANPLESLNNAWFLAGLFHDIGVCLEKSFKAGARIVELLEPFSDIMRPALKIESAALGGLLSKAKPFIAEQFDDPMATYVRKALERSTKDQEPDQGIVAALYLNSMLNDGSPLSCLAREAARAAALHNLFPSNSASPAFELSNLFL